MSFGIHCVLTDCGLGVVQYLSRTLEWPLLRICGHYLQWIWIIHYFWTNKIVYTLLLLLCHEDPKFLGHSPAEMQICHLLVVILPIILNFWDCRMWFEFHIPWLHHHLLLYDLWILSPLGESQNSTCQTHDLSVQVVAVGQGWCQSIYLAYLLVHWPCLKCEQS